MNENKLPWRLGSFLPNLTFCWRCLTIGLLTLPLIPSVGAVFIAISLIFTWLNDYRLIVRLPLNWGFALLSLLFIISVGFAFNQTEALLGLFNFLPFFLVFAGFSSLIQKPSQLRYVSWIVVIASIPVVLLGWGQMFWGWTTPIHWQSICGWKIVPGGNPPGRMASVFMYANTLASYLIMVFILGLGLWLENYQRWRNLLSFPIRDQAKIKICIRYIIILSAIAIANLLTLILTNSRNAWAIALIVCLVYAIYQGWQLLVAGVVGISAAISIAAFAPTSIAEVFRQIVPSFFWARLNDQLYPERPLALMRTTQWDFAINLTWQRPLTGWGLRNFTQLYQNQMDVWLGHPHNLFLMLSAETGLPATLLFCGLFATIAITSIKSLRTTTLSSAYKSILFSYILFLISLALFNTVDVSIFDFRVNVFSWVLLSCLTGISFRYKDMSKLQ
ncbi:MAG: O-antigen ligase family protein [Richelia sp.]|nr:O-antigen ligase family protein [Richelia sp.]CDN14143.1 Lipid A core O-antigen ligase related Slr0728 [Richelia intracellularis]